MLKSMTAFGRGTFTSALGHFSVEIQSVNRKFLDVQIQLPKELTRFDGELRRWLAPLIARGQVTLKANAAFNEKSPLKVRPNLPLAKQLKNAWMEIAKELNISESEFDLELLSAEEGLMTYEDDVQDEDLYCEALKKASVEAFIGFEAMKIKEGAVLQHDISSRIGAMCDKLALIQMKAPHATVKYREKLMARLQEVVPGNIENEDKILREIALFAEKIDITEEITRFDYHLKHALELLASNESVGKTFEFVLQELGREINTIGSKSSDKDIARLVIEVKSELEKIREQIQNIE